MVVDVDDLAKVQALSSLLLMYHLVFQDDYVSTYIALKNTWQRFAYFAKEEYSDSKHIAQIGKYKAMSLRTAAHKADSLLRFMAPEVYQEFNTISNPGNRVYIYEPLLTRGFSKIFSNIGKNRKGLFEEDKNDVAYRFMKKNERYNTKDNIDTNDYNAQKAREFNGMYKILDKLLIDYKPNFDIYLAVASLMGHEHILFPKTSKDTDWAVRAANEVMFPSCGRNIEACFDKADALIDSAKQFARKSQILIKGEKQRVANTYAIREFMKFVLGE